MAIQLSSLRCWSGSQKAWERKSTPRHTHTATYINELHEEERKLMLLFKKLKCQDRQILNNFKFTYSKINQVLCNLLRKRHYSLLPSMEERPLTYRLRKLFLTGLTYEPYITPQASHVFRTELCTSNCFKAKIVILNIRSVPIRVSNKLFSNL